jgi:hypothetical protein
MIESFKSIIRDILEIKISKDSMVRIIEDGIDGTLKEITIIEMPDNVFVFSLDTNSKETTKEIRNLLFNKQKKHIHTGCDAILLHQLNDEEVCFYFIEVKSSRPQPKDYEIQMINSLLFVNYVTNWIETFEKDFDYKIHIEFRLFYLQKMKPMNKQGVVVRKSSPHVRDSSEIKNSRVKNSIIKIGFLNDEGVQRIQFSDIQMNKRQ